MEVTVTPIPDLLLLTPKVFGDDRGFFMESYNQKSLKEIAKIDSPFVQDNHSRSVKGTLRGIHYQIRHPQGKLVRVTRGKVYDVAVDLRRSSSSFGQWQGFELSEENKQMLWVPPGFGHGFLVMSDTAEFLYKTTDFYSPQDERCILWNDKTLKIDWPIDEEPLLSDKDSSGAAFGKAEVFT